MAQEPEVKVRIAADDAGLLASLGRATAGIKSFGSNVEGQMAGLTKSVQGLMGPLMSMAALVGGGALFKGAVDSTVEYAGTLTKLSRVLGITKDEAAVLAQGIRNIHGSTDDFLAGSARLVKNLSESEDKLRSLGIATRDSNGNFRSMASLLPDVYAKLSEYREGTDRDVVAQRIFGKSWQEMLRFVQLTPEVMDAARAKVDQLGLKLGQDEAKVKAYRKATRDLDDSFLALKVRVGTELMPTLANLATHLTSAAPAAITGVVSLLNMLVGLLSYTSVQATALALVVRATLWPSLVSLAKTLWTIIQYTAAFGMEGLIYSLGAVINPVTAVIVAIGALCLALEWLSRAEQRAKENWEAHVRQVKDGDQAWITATREVVELEAAMKAASDQSERKTKLQEKLNLTVDKLLAAYPELSRFLKDEAGHQRTIAEAIKLANAERERAIRLEVTENEAALASFQAQIERRKVQIAAEKAASVDEAKKGNLRTANLHADNASAAEKELAKDQEIYDRQQRILQVSKDRLTVQLGINAEEGRATPKPSGTPKENIYEAERVKLAQELNKARSEATADGKLAVALAKEEETITKALLDLEQRRQEIQKAVKDKKLNSVQAEKLEAQAVEVANAQVKAAREKAATERLAYEKEQDEQNAQLYSIREQRRRDHSLAMLDLDKDEVERRYDLGQIDAQQRLDQIRAIEEKRYQIEEKALRDRLALANLEPAERARILSEIQALNDRRAQSQQGFSFQQSQLDQQGDGKAGFMSGIKEFIASSRNAFQNWKGFATSTIQSVTNALASNVTSMLTGQTKLKDGLKAIWKQISQSIIANRSRSAQPSHLA